MSFALLVTACASAADTPDATATTTTQQTTTTLSPTVPQTTTTDPVPAEFPPGVVWEQSVVAETRGLQVTSVEPTPDGWIIAAYELTEVGTTSVVFTSPNGTQWNRTGLPPSTSDTLVYDVVAGPTSYVAIGFAGEQCNAGCLNGNGIAWVSAGGQTWQLIEPDAFAGPNRVIPREIRVIDGRYVAVGNDEGDGIDQVVRVWSSADGIDWEATAVLDYPDWPVERVRGFLVWDGGYVITAARARCAEPVRQSLAGWSWSLSRTETMAWTSTDGADWESMDLASAGLVQPYDDAICASGTNPSRETITAAFGNMVGVGGRLFWQGGVADMMELDPDIGTWSSTPVVIPPTVVADKASGVPLFVLADDLGFVAGGPDRLFRDEVWVVLARSPDLLTWQERYDETTLFPALDEEFSDLRNTFLITNGTGLLAGCQGSTQILGEEGPVMALISRAGPTGQPYNVPTTDVVASSAEPAIRPEWPHKGAECRGPENDGRVVLDLSGYTIHGKGRRNQTVRVKVEVPVSPAERPRPTGVDNGETSLRAS